MLQCDVVWIIFHREKPLEYQVYVPIFLQNISGRKSVENFQSKFDRQQEAVTEQPILLVNLRLGIKSQKSSSCGNVKRLQLINISIALIHDEALIQSLVECYRRIKSVQILKLKQ